MEERSNHKCGNAI